MYLKFHLRAKSHFTVGNSLMEGLARAGHQVTMISPFKPSRSLKNYTLIQIDGILDVMKGTNYVEAERIQKVQ